MLSNVHSVYLVYGNLITKGKHLILNAGDESETKSGKRSSSKGRASGKENANAGKSSPNKSSPSKPASVGKKSK